MKIRDYTLTNETILTREQAYSILQEAYDHLDCMDDLLRGSPRFFVAKRTWCKILTHSEWDTIKTSLDNLHEIIGGVLDDLEQGKPLPYDECGEW